MKKLLFFMSLAALVTGCSTQQENEPGIIPGDNNEITVDAAISESNPGVKSTISGSTATWKTGDQIGLFCPETFPVVAANVMFTVANAPASPTWTTTTPVYWKDGTTLHKFTAYAPYASGNTSASSVKLPALGNQTGTIDPTMDFLISNNLNTTGVARSNNPIGLIFTHAYSLIQFQMTVNASIVANTTLKSLVLTAGGSDKFVTTDASSTIDLSTGTITPATTASTITVTPATPPVLSSTTYNIYVLILPGTFTAPTLKINLSEGGTTDISPATVTLSNTAFAAGSKYSYTVSISRTAVDISNPTITDWNNVTGNPLNPGI